MNIDSLSLLLSPLGIPLLKESKSPLLLRIFDADIPQHLQHQGRDHRRNYFDFVECNTSPLSFQRGIELRNPVTSHHNINTLYLSASRAARTSKMARMSALSQSCWHDRYAIRIYLIFVPASSGFSRSPTLRGIFYTSPLIAFLLLFMRVACPIVGGLNLPNV